MGKTKTVVVSGAPEEKDKKDKKKKAHEKRKSAKAPGLKGGERVVAVSGEVLPSKEKEVKAKKAAKKKVRGKKYLEARGKIDQAKNYPLEKAVKLTKETSYSSFDGTVELHLVVKKKGLRINVSLPHSAGKKKKVEIADEKTIEKLEQGKVDFDVLLTTKEYMPKLVPFARLLGPKGLMPNPKNGTIITSKSDAKKFSGNTLTIKTEKSVPLIHVPVGKVSQKEDEIKENVETILTQVGKKSVEKAYLTSTMGPSIKVKVS